jgi:thiol-disulfide isomerase/thioredoxin
MSYAENAEKTDDTTKIYNFNTAWCGYSVQFQPEWLELENSTKDMSNITAIDVKCDEEGNKQLCKDYDIDGFPTVIIEKNGKRKVYNGDRNAGAILAEASK